MILAWFSMKVLMPGCQRPQHLPTWYWHQQLQHIHTTHHWGWTLLVIVRLLSTDFKAFWRAWLIAARKWKFHLTLKQSNRSNRCWWRWKENFSIKKIGSAPISIESWIGICAGKRHQTFQYCPLHYVLTADSWMSGTGGSAPDISTYYLSTILRSQWHSEWPAKDELDMDFRTWQTIFHGGKSRWLDGYSSLPDGGLPTMTVDWSSRE